MFPNDATKRYARNISSVGKRVGNERILRSLSVVSRDASAIGSDRRVSARSRACIIFIKTSRWRREGIADGYYHNPRRNALASTRPVYPSFAFSIDNT